MPRTPVRLPERPHPLSPLALRTRLQSSLGAAFAAWLSAIACCTSGGVLESSFQFGGGGGAGGIGGGGGFLLGWLRGAGGVFGPGQNQPLTFGRRSRRADVRYYIHFFALLDLQEAGRQAIGLGVYVEQVVSAGRPLRRQSQGAPLDLLQRGNFFGAQQQVVFDPPFRAARPADLQEAAAALHDFEPLAVLDGGHHRRLQRDVPAQAQRGRAGVSFADRRRARFAAPARGHGEYQQEKAKTRCWVLGAGSWPTHRRRFEGFAST